MNGVGGRGPGERVLHGTGGTGGASRKSVVRRSTLKEAGAGVRREAHVGRATLTMEARLAGKQEKERAQAYMKTQRMRDPSYWCAPGVDDEEEAGEEGGLGGGEASEGADADADAGAGAGAGASASAGAIAIAGAGAGGDDEEYGPLAEPVRKTAEENAAELTRLLTCVAKRTNLLVPPSRGAGVAGGGGGREGAGGGDTGDAATRSGRAHY